MIGAFGTGLDTGIAGEEPVDCLSGERGGDDGCRVLADSRGSLDLGIVVGAGDTVGIAIPEDTEAADPSTGCFTRGLPPDCITSFCDGALARPAAPIRPGNRTSRPQREHGLLLTSHSLPQRGQVMICPSLTDYPALSKIFTWSPSADNATP